MLKELIEQRTQVEKQLLLVKEKIREERKRMTLERRGKAKEKAENRAPANQRELDLHEKIRRIRVSAADALCAKGATWAEIYDAIGWTKQKIEEARNNCARRDAKKPNV